MYDNSSGFTPVPTDASGQPLYMSGHEPGTPPSAGGAPTTSSWGSKLPWGNILGGTAAGIGALIGEGGMQDPYAAAEPYLQQIPGTLKQYMGPYIGAGTAAIPTLEEQYSSLLQDPTAMMRAIGAHYKASPGYQYNVGQATRGANQAAAAGGMVGSPAEQQALAGRISGLASQDYGNFMNRALDMYQTGLSGWGGLERGGQMASQQLSENLARALESQAKLKEAQAQSQNIQQGGTAGGVGGMIGGIISDIF